MTARARNEGAEAGRPAYVPGRRGRDLSVPVRLVLLAVALALGASGPAASQAGAYIYLECDVSIQGDRVPRAYRIGNGRWDFLADNSWEALEWVDCGGQRQDGSMISRRTCTFTDREFVSEVRTVVPSLPGFEVLTRHDVSRFTGQIRYAYLTTNGSDNRTVSGTCKPIPEPKPERKF